ncbi:MAG: MFS transporter [Acidimicrobiia bacterium]
MYSSLRDRPVEATPAAVDGPGAPSDKVDGNVVALGVTSFFSDISSEMVNAVLPLYLMLTLGFSPLQFGLFDGAYQGMTGLLRIAGGVVADRRRRYKEVAGFGYGLSAACKLGLLASQAWGVTTAVLFADRTGKGIRTAPRDALISLSSPKDRLAESFGVHRALDTAGALLGPVVAFVVLGVAPRAYDAVFVASFCAGLIGLGVLFCFVQNRSPVVTAGVARPSWRAAAGLLRIPRFRRLVIAGGLLGLVTVSDAFIYLVFQRRTGMPSRPFPLLFVGTALAYLTLAVPLGRLADRVGRAAVFVAGHVVLVGAYLVLRTAGPGLPTALLLLGLLGCYYAATDGVLMALTSTALPAELRSSGLALLTTVTTLARFAAALIFGLMWTLRGPDGAVVLFLAGLVVALPVAVGILFSDRRAVAA